MRAHGRAFVAGGHGDGTVVDCVADDVVEGGDLVCVESRGGRVVC